MPEIGATSDSLWHLRSESGTDDGRNGPGMSLSNCGEEERARGEGEIDSRIARSPASASRSATRSLLPVCVVRSRGRGGMPGKQVVTQTEKGKEER